ncbi:MAG TPA: hypothetical protein VGK85_02510, partial [Myxococcaceae bacterium]
MGSPGSAGRARGPRAACYLAFVGRPGEPRAHLGRAFARPAARRAWCAAASGSDVGFAARRGGTVRGAQLGSARRAATGSCRR